MRMWRSPSLASALTLAGDELRMWCSAGAKGLNLLSTLMFMLDPGDNIDEEETLLQQTEMTATKTLLLAGSDRRKSVVKQLKDYSTFSETHCTTRESQSDATTFCHDDKVWKKIVPSHGEFYEDSQSDPTGNTAPVELSYDVLGTYLICDSQICERGTAKMKTKDWLKYMKKRPRELRINDEDLLMTAIVKNKDLGICHKFASGSSAAKKFKKLKSHKKGNKLLSKIGKAGTNLLGGKRSSLGLFLESGKSYTLCLVEAWSAESMSRRSNAWGRKVEAIDESDDTCGFCGDGGELLCCDNCPSTYHQACLSAKELPEGSWYCHNCTCQLAIGYARISIDWVFSISLR
ncbi:Increased DNA methylation 1 [Zea mays]|uniref:Increased DNA methylation 1 n=1 Tax=Zea mays TaxID=4577 RepID=A0A3L6DVV5_MAIZE|nr:Increased DNA methylation 1 [Zea mays]